MNDMSDQEKSVLLAKAMGWRVFRSGNIQAKLDGSQWMTKDLYDPANMALAWRVLNWANSQKHYYAGFQGYSGLMFDFLYHWLFSDETFFELSPADAQRLWLDKILELAIEAGLVEVTE